MSSSKKRQSTRKTDLPDWAADVKPSEDVMAMFYAPTGLPKPGPLVPPSQLASVAPPQTDLATDKSDEEVLTSAGRQPEPEKENEIPGLIQAPTEADLETQRQATSQEERGASDVLAQGGSYDESPGSEYDVESTLRKEGQQEQARELAHEKDGENSEPSSMPGENVAVHQPLTGEVRFETYFGQWVPFLTAGQVKILRALFNMTYAVGCSECLTSTSRLAEAADMSERQTSSIARDLEKLGFIARPETFNTKTKKGTVFQLFLSRQNSPPREKRRYHFDDFES